MYFPSLLQILLSLEHSHVYFEEVLKRSKTLERLLLIVLVSAYLISRYFFMIPQTRKLPKISTMTRKESTVVMATVADSDMIVERQR